jgi:hypothetical protein
MNEKQLGTERARCLFWQLSWHAQHDGTTFDATFSDRELDLGLGGETCAKSSATPITVNCAPRRSIHHTLARILRNAGFKGNDDGPRTV